MILKIYLNQGFIFYLLRGILSKILRPWNLGGSADHHGTIFFRFLMQGKSKFSAFENEFWPKYLIFIARGVRIGLSSHKKFFSQNIKFHPICMKFISEVKNRGWNAIQVHFSFFNYLPWNKSPNGQICNFLFVTHHSNIIKKKSG